MRSLTASMLLALALPAAAQSPEPRIALKGYDPVAYFTQGKPVKGVSRISHDWDDTRHYFSTAKHREMFAADPERYAPRFSGNCTGAVLKGMKYEADPEAWAIINGKLYMFSSATTRKQLEGNPEAIARAEAAWRATPR